MNVVIKKSCSSCFNKVAVNCHSEQVNIKQKIWLDSKSSPDLIKEVFQRDNLEADPLLYCFVSSRERSEGRADSQPLAVLLSEWLSRVVSQTEVQGTAQHIRKWSSCCLKGEMCFTRTNTHSRPNNMRSLTLPLCMSVQEHTLLEIEMAFSYKLDQSLLPVEKYPWHFCSFHCVFVVF